MGDGGVGEELTEVSSFAYVIVLHCSSVSKSHINKIKSDRINCSMD